MRFAFVFPLILMGCSLGGNRAPDPVLSSHGSVCGDPAIRGMTIGAVDGTGGCGIDQAVEVTQIGGIALSQPSRMRCEKARVFKAWIDQKMVPTIGDTGGGVSGLRIAAHYVCRTRNHQPGARLSEHAKGNAIDIAAFQLRDGSEISVLSDWGEGEKGRILRRLHASACGPYGTVLGPESDPHHRDHFHFDIADHGYGPYCR